MKYIRTKAGSLFEVLEEKEDLFVCKSHYEKRPLLNTNDIGKWAVVNQADTIEELCDEFVCINNGCYGIHDTLLEAKSYADYREIVYGAIWTDKGLIYVAKLNEEGELELL